MIIIVVGDTPSSVEINEGGRIGDPSKMAAAQYISSNRQRQSMGRLPIDPFNVCKHRKPRLGARAAWGQKNGAANRPAYYVKEKQTSLIDR